MACKATLDTRSGLGLHRYDKHIIAVRKLTVGMGSSTLSNTNKFISRWPNTNRQISDCQILQIQFVKYKFQTFNSFCNIHPMIMLLTDYHLL